MDLIVEVTYNERLHGSVYKDYSANCHQHYQLIEEIIRGSPDHFTDNFVILNTKKLWMLWLILMIYIEIF